VLASFSFPNSVWERTPPKLRFAHNSRHDPHTLPHLRERLSLFHDLHHRRLAPRLHAPAVNILFDSWKWLQENRGFKLYGYVILENHLHLIASAPELSNAMKSFKMYTARQLIDLLEQHSAQVLLRQLRALKLPHKTKSVYQLWQEGSKPKQIGGDGMMRQKLEYMHNNPVERGYVDDPVHWKYSSARNYAGLPGLIDVVTDWA
jgi:REP element-mobilizing transposase RayT